MPNMEQVELILSNVLLVLQLYLSLWQFTKLTPVGALIKGFVGWSLRPLRLSTTYTLLQGCRGRVFKKVRCYVLQADLPLQRKDIQADLPLQRRDIQADLPLQRRDIQAVTRNKIKLYYLGSRFILERSGSEMNMLFINGVMCYYITPQKWEQLYRLSNVLNVDILSEYDADAADAAAAAGDDAASAAAAYYYAATAAAAAVFLRGHRKFWEVTSTGGVMSLDEVLDEIILYDKQVSALLDDDWLLPVNLSVSGEKLLKIINLLGLFLQIKKVKIHWLIPTSLSFISALMEFSTIIRVWLYEHINLFFCYIMHFICDQLSYSQRRRVYYLGKFVENLKPYNDIDLKVVKGDIFAVIIEGVNTKVGKEGAVRVDWLHIEELETEIIFGKSCTQMAVLDRSCRPHAHLQGATTQMTVHCRQLGTDPIYIMCQFDATNGNCVIRAGNVGEISVNCSQDQFIKMTTFIVCIAKSPSGSLISYGPGNTLHIRRFKESVLHYAETGFPSVYELKFENAVIK